MDKKETMVAIPSKGIRFLAMLICLAAPFLVFSNSLGHDFVNWDDDIYVYNNNHISLRSLDDVLWWFTNPYFYSYIPLTMLSHSIDHAWWGLDARGHHLTSVVIHSLNTVWMFLLCMALLQVLRGRGSSGEAAHGVPSASTLFGAVAGALLFALHPLRAESVAWISDRKDLLCMFFLLPSVLLYLRFSKQRGTQSGKRLYLASFALFVCAVLSKSVAIALPVVLLLLDLLTEGRWVQRVKEKVPFFAVAVLIIFISLGEVRNEKVAYAVARLEGVEHLLFPFASILFYLRKTLLPAGLSPIYPAVSPAEMIIGFVVVGAITVACVLLARRGKLLFLVVWIVYLLLLGPTLVGLASGMQPVADRYSYVSTAHFFFLLGGGVAAGVERGTRALRYAITVGILCVTTTLAILSARQSGYWRTSERLWTYVIDSFPATPDYVNAYLNLGGDYAGRFRDKEARQMFERVTQIDPTNPDGFYNLGWIMFVVGETENAAAMFLRATELDSSFAPAFYNLAISYSTLGMDDKSLPHMQKAARLGHTEAQQALRDRGLPW